MFVIIASVLLLSTATEVSSGVCTDGKVILNESNGQLASPEGVKSGACTWVISVPNDQRIIFYFKSLNIGRPNDGSYGERECGDQETLIELKDSLNDWPWKTYCEGSKPQPIATNNSTLTIEFKLSPEGDSKSWFIAEYTTLPFEKKIDLRETPSAEITSPMFPGRYPRNSYFKWSVFAPPGFRIKIEFTKLDIQGYGYECQRDALIVRDGPSDQSKLIAKICGKDKREIHSSGNSMTLEFVSEVKSSNEDNIGFNATLSEEAKLYLILVPCGIGIVLVSFIVGAIVVMYRRRRSSSSAGNPRMQMSLLNDDDHMSATQMSEADPPNEANLPVYRPTTQVIKS